jgi:hypothetical protein
MVALHSVHRWAGMFKDVVHIKGVRKHLYRLAGISKVQVLKDAPPFSPLRII